MTEVAKVVTRMANLSRMAQVVRGEGVVDPFMRKRVLLSLLSMLLPNPEDQVPPGSGSAMKVSRNPRSR